jgi:regulator of protease activity HflC (stomatin/prohibitin superfamily)
MKKILSAVITILAVMSFTSTVFASDKTKPIVIADDPAAVTHPVYNKNDEHVMKAEAKAAQERTEAETKAEAKKTKAKVKAEAKATKAKAKAEAKATKAKAKADAEAIKEAVPPGK